MCQLVTSHHGDNRNITPDGTTPYRIDHLPRGSLVVKAPLASNNKIDIPVKQVIGLDKKIGTAHHLAAGHSFDSIPYAATGPRMRKCKGTASQHLVYRSRHIAEHRLQTGETRG